MPDLKARFGEARLVRVDADQLAPDVLVEVQGRVSALALALAALCEDQLGIEWTSVRDWAGRRTLVVGTASGTREVAISAGDQADVEGIAAVFAGWMRKEGAARLVLCADGDGVAVARCDALSVLSGVPLSCPACGAGLDAAHWWDSGRCGLCGQQAPLARASVAGSPSRMAGPEDSIEHALSDALDLLSASDHAGRRGLSPELARLLLDLGVAVPADGADPSEVDDALAAARRQLLKPSVEALVEAARGVLLEEPVDDDRTDPGFFLDDPGDS